ncbi:MAG: insulinase family protein [Calditrichaeota bacterium]|nr:MAG: insulinase family protein [Calditrichota bacterium]
MHLNIAFESFRLDNGLTVILHRDTTIPIVAVNLWYNVGSWNERPGKTGLAHLFEHMMFQGTRQVPGEMYFRLIQSRGGTMNGATSFNRTTYHETLPSHHLEMALWLEADRMRSLADALTQEKLDNQRSVVKNERRQQVDNQPYGLWLEKTLEMAYPGEAPYHWPIIGYMDDLDGATLDDVRAFFYDYYCPANASLVIAGDMDTDQVKKWLDHYFGDIPSGARAVEPRWTWHVNGTGEKRMILTDRVHLPRLHISYHVPGLEEESFTTAEILNAILSSGKSSRLYDQLVFRRPVAREAYSFLLPLLRSGLLVFIATPLPETSVGQVETALQQEIDRLCQDGVTENELHRIKNQLTAYKVRELQNVEYIANSLNQHHSLFGDPERINTELEKYRSVTREQVEAFARRYLHKDNRVVLTILPGTEEKL